MRAKSILSLWPTVRVTRTRAESTDASLLECQSDCCFLFREQKPDKVALQKLCADGSGPRMSGKTFAVGLAEFPCGSRGELGTSRHLVKRCLSCSVRNTFEFKKSSLRVRPSARRGPLLTVVPDSCQLTILMEAMVGGRGGRGVCVCAPTARQTASDLEMNSRVLP